MRVEFKFRTGTYLNCRTYTVPSKFELTACPSIASKPLLKLLHFGKILKKIGQNLAKFSFKDPRGYAAISFGSSRIRGVVGRRPLRTGLRSGSPARSRIVSGSGTPSSPRQICRRRNHACNRISGRSPNRFCVVPPKIHMVLCRAEVYTRVQDFRV